LAGYKVPVVIDIRFDEMPKNASGKVLKRTLRDELVNAGRHEGQR
jgi:acyl-CoA synthetase (AMP-forming)/AMP-acid ligase II